MSKNVSQRNDLVELAMIDHDGIPHSFRWHGHRYVVQRIVMHWVESGPWWQSISQSFFAGEFADADAVDVTWHIWRVEAQSMGGVLLGDVAQRVSLFSSSADPWRMIRVLD